MDNNINNTPKRGRGRPKKIIDITEEPKVKENKVEIIFNDDKSISEIEEEEHSENWDEKDDDFLNELDNEHYNDAPLQNIDDLFKNIKPKKQKKEKIKSHFEDDNSLFSEKGTEILGSERRQLLSKIQQYKNLFPDELKKFKIKKNCSVQDLNLYLEEMETIVNCGSVEQFLTDSILQCIKLTEGISSYTKYDISGCADMLKSNKQFHTLCKQLYIKYKVFSNIPPEYSIIILISTTAYMCRVKNSRKKELEVFLNEKIDKPIKKEE